MTKNITDTLGNTITFNYDDTTDVVTVTNSSFGNTPMVVKSNDADGVVPNVIMIVGTDLSTWSDEETKKELINFWFFNKKTK
jgi:hypothetical protein